MIRAGDRIFVDTGAWVAVALRHDTHHAEAAAVWTELLMRGARACTSIPVVIETFTWLQRRASPEAARVWRQALVETPRLELLDCAEADLAAAWPWLERKDLHKLSLVDAISFVLMRRHRIRRVFTFDAHFAQAGFRSL